jgi:hypothetical protein
VGVLEYVVEYIRFSLHTIKKIVHLILLVYHAYFNKSFFKYKIYISKKSMYVEFIHCHFFASFEDVNRSEYSC